MMTTKDLQWWLFVSAVLSPNTTPPIADADDIDARWIQRRVASRLYDLASRLASGPERLLRRLSGPRERLTAAVRRLGGRISGCGCLAHDPEDCAVLVGGEHCECTCHDAELVASIAVTSGFSPREVHQAMKHGATSLDILRARCAAMPADAFVPKGTTVQ